MKAVKILLALSLVGLICVGCENTAQEDEGLHGEKFGKDLTITVTENECVDAEYLQKVLDGEIKKDVPYFDLWDEEELKELIDYMAQNEYVIIPGQYTLNQTWLFEDGMFVLSSGEKCEVFKFKDKGRQEDGSSAFKMN